MKRSKLMRLSAVVMVAAILAFSGFFAGRASAYQGHMWSALDHLNAALDQLQDATPDKDGHRANAIELVQQAINQTNAGISAGSR
jgi:hypothetical protein